jgi:hypothetical protein
MAWNISIYELYISLKVINAIARKESQILLGIKVKANDLKTTTKNEKDTHHQMTFRLYFHHSKIIIRDIY